MDEAFRSHRHVPSDTSSNANISTANQPEGSAKRPRDTLDREPARDPESGGAIPSNYNPETTTRLGEEEDTQAGRDMAEQENELKGDQ